MGCGLHIAPSTTDSRMTEPNEIRNCSNEEFDRIYGLNEMRNCSDEEGEEDQCGEGFEEDEEYEEDQCGEGFEEDEEYVEDEGGEECEESERGGADEEGEKDGESEQSEAFPYVTREKRFLVQPMDEIHEDEGGVEDGEDEKGEEHEEGEPFPYVTRGTQFVPCPTGEEQEDYEREDGEGGGEEHEEYGADERGEDFPYVTRGKEHEVYEEDREDEGDEEHEENGGDEESDIRDSEINEYKEAVHKLLKFRAFKIKGPNGQLRCPFCYGMEKHDYNTLLKHAIRVGEDSRESAKQRANHFAMARYLVIDLDDGAEQLLQGTKKTLCNHANEIDFGKENLDQLQAKFIEKTRSIHRILEEKDETHRTFFEEARNLLGIARDQLKGLLEQQEMLNFDFENKKRRLNSWREELNKREAALNNEKTKMDDLMLGKNDLDLLYQHLLAKERPSSGKLLGAHTELVKGLEDMPSHCRVNIGVKRSIHDSVSDLWNFLEDRKATACEVIRHIFAQWKTLQCKRDEIDEVIRSLF